MSASQLQKKSNGCVNALAVIGVVALLLIAAVVILFFLPSSSMVNAPAARNEVVYKIRFNNGVSNPNMDKCAEFGVTYAMPNGTAQKDMEACAFTEVDRFRGEWGDYLYLSIQNTAPQNSIARFSCIIEVDGKKVAETESIGWPNIASCSLLLE